MTVFNLFGGFGYLFTDPLFYQRGGENLGDWKKIVDTGDPKTLRKAETYCRGDVREGLGVFYKLVNAIETSGRIVYR